jgi:hypothetical protein
MIKTTSAVLLAGAACLCTSQAGLINQGNGLIYDTVLDITWLQDANLAATNTFGVSGINADGTMDWLTAQQYVAAMNAAKYLGFSNWRLPKSLPVDGISYDTTLSWDGSTDFGWNIVSPNAELQYMHNVNLKNPNFTGTNGVSPQPGWTNIPNMSFIDAATGQPDSFINYEPHFGSTVDTSRPASYWSGSVAPTTDTAWVLRTANGSQSFVSKTCITSAGQCGYMYVWPVHDGSSVRVNGIAVKKAWITPTTVKRGDSVDVFAQISGDRNKIGEVVFMLGNNRLTTLTDPDSDGIWSGQYRIAEAKGYRGATKIYVKGPKGKVIAKWPGFTVTD